MKGKWEVIHNYVGGELICQVVRIRDTREVRHAGNMETDSIFDTDEAAQERANELNIKDKLNEIRQALTALGYKDTVKVVAVELDEDRAQVILPDDGGEMGIYDFIKHTFVD